MAHGEQDMVVPFDLGKASFELITKEANASPKHVFKSYPDLEHAANEEEIGTLIEWINETKPHVK